MIRAWLGVLSIGTLIALSGACSNGGGATDGPNGAGGNGLGGDGSTGGSTPVIVPATTLPIEVLGDGNPKAPVVGEVKLELSGENVEKVSTLSFQCHRCGFYGAPEFEATTAPITKVKASVRFVGGVSGAELDEVPWIDINDENVVLHDSARIHGGVNGGLFTVRATLALDSAARARAVSGENVVQFRFNGTDGESNGFRILKLELDDASGLRLNEDVLEERDTALDRETAGLTSADVEAGRTLWYGGKLKKSSIVDRAIEASCSSCHASDGRDLQYFNYSNNAIVQRSRFHGLSEKEGTQIAAFLRKTLEDIPNHERARPWNPPYQPGAGLDCAGGDCVGSWAAGAGLDAVLETPDAAVRALFGKPLGGEMTITQADVDAVMSANATHNVRETAIAMQFPDWNAWLPSVHPADVWKTTSSGGSFLEGAEFSNGPKDPLSRYADLRDWFSAHRNPEKPGDYSHLSPAERREIKEKMSNAGWETYGFLGGGRGNHIAETGLYGAQEGAKNLSALASTSTTDAGPDGAFTEHAFIERAVESLLHWNAVQQWDIAQTYELEGNQTWFIGDYDEGSGTWKGRGEAHGWPFNAPSVFYLAPHMTYQTDTDADEKVTREWYLAWEAENIVSSYYRTNQWYQLQMTINAGGQSDWVNFPMDWPYLTGFDELIAEKVGDASPEALAERYSHNVRLLQGRIKSAQYVNNSITLYDPAETNLIDNRGRYGRGQVAKHLAVANYLDKSSTYGTSKSPYHFLDDVAPGLYLLVVNGGIQMFDELYADTDPAAWRRCDPANTTLGESETIAGFRFCLDSAKKPLGTNEDGSLFMNYTDYGIPTEQVEQYGLWKAEQLGTETTRTQKWSAWVASVWP